MLYQKPRFSVSAGPNGTLDCHGRHPFADSKGKCVRCGDKIRPDLFAEKPQHDLDERWELGRHKPTDAA